MPEPKQQSSGVVTSDDSANYPSPVGRENMPLQPFSRSWEINRERVEIIKVIGKGAFSQVSKATAWNIRGNEEYTTVAVKMLKGVIRHFALLK